MIGHTSNVRVVTTSPADEAPIKKALTGAVERIQKDLDLANEQGDQALVTSLLEERSTLNSLLLAHTG